MVRITREDLNGLEVLGSGVFGTVYKKDNKTAYKIYHNKVYNKMGMPMDNPALTATRLHYKLLLARKDFIKQSKLIQDFIYMPGGFAGVVVPYCDGSNMSKTKLSLDKRIGLAKELVDKGKELNDHFIYPTDYQLGNMKYSNGHAELLDLDDIRTHALIYPSPLFSLFSVSSLGEVIQDLLGQYSHTPITTEAAKLIERDKGFYATSYKRIEDYINRKEKERTIYFIDRNTDLYEACRYSYLFRYPVVYIIDKDEKMEYVIERLRIHGIKIYDFVSRDSLRKYPEVENVRESYMFKDNDYKRLYKKR